MFFSPNNSGIKDTSFAAMYFNPNLSNISLETNLFIKSNGHLPSNSSLYRLLIFEHSKFISSWI